MITFEIIGGVRVYGLPKKIREKVYYDLTFENKQYSEAKKRGRYISSDLLPELHFFSVNKEEKYIYIPRGYFYVLHKYIHGRSIPHKIIDKTLSFNKLYLKFNGTARDYQELALNDVLRYPIGVLQGSTGCGKTFMGINIIQKRQQPTLIIVHSKELLNQWTKSIEELLEVESGIIGAGKEIIKPITVGIINSVRNKAELLRNKFGHIIMDEVHRCPSTMWTETLGRFPAKYYLGLSATVYRNDGLGKAINAFIGPTIHRVNKEYLHKTGAVLKPKIIRIETNFSTPPRTEYSSVVQKMTKDKDRNNLIINTVINDLKTYNSPVLIVSDRVNHCEKLTDILESKGYNVSLLLSKLSKKDRLEAVEDIRDGDSQILIATVSLIGEGFDAPNLHALFLTTPISYIGRIVQTIGRVLRPEKGKTARVYDFRDNLIWMIRTSGKKRDKVYKSEW